MTTHMHQYKITGPVLVTGGAGYIGGHTVLTLLDQGVEVCVIDDLSTGKKVEMHDRVHFYEGSIHNQALVSDILQTHAVKSILHFAGSIKVDESVSDPLKYYYNNTEGSRRLIECATHAGVETFIFSSTAAVYGKTGDAPVDERFVAQPLNPYGWSKLFTEQQLKDTSTVAHLNYGIFRYFNVAGADPALRHGQYMDNPTHLIGRATDAVLGKGAPLTVFGKALSTPDGTGVRDYIHVSDVADAHLALLSNMQAHPRSLLLNLGYGHGSSVLEVIAAIEAAVGKTVPYDFGRPRPGEAPFVIADIDALNQTLSWAPRFASLDEIVRSSYNWAVKRT